MAPIIKHKKFNAKKEQTKTAILEALDILTNLGIFLEKLSSRRLEKMCMSFLSVCDVNEPGKWKEAKCFSQSHRLRSRDIIDYINDHFEENISKGSYDDIRRKDLLRPVNAGIVVRTIPESSRNNPTRRYALSDDYVTIVRDYGSVGWEERVKQFLQNKPIQREVYQQKPDLHEIPVQIPGGKKIQFSPGPHNTLQKEIIEKFLPKFGLGAEVWYIGDTSDKYLVYEKEKLNDIGFFDLEHAELPDVVAYAREKNLLYLIEAFHSTGTMSIDRYINLKSLTEKCTAKCIFITAFLDFNTYKKHSTEIAWETEVWIAEIPEHMIHFNGPKFLSAV
jgi:type II restriction enzyme